MGHTFLEEDLSVNIKIKKCLYCWTQQFHSFRTNLTDLLTSMHKEMYVVISPAAF